ncbi:MAG: copper chaperone PCu(A)C [Propionibacteriales bacterium]|nr:copper chaperone PCu(A)C [Propionibacteriales bacterium]
MKRLTTLLLLAATTVGLTACGSSSDADPATEASTVSVQDPWVKAADSGMTAAFGTFRNAADHDVTIVSATTDGVAGRVELHEMATDEDGQMVMRQKKGGIVVPAGKTHTLEPGGDHIMLMDLTRPVEPGQDVRVTVRFSDDSTMSFTAPARSFAGAEEDYEGGTDHGDMEHGDMDHGDHG